MPCACHNEAVEENWEGGAYWIAQEMCNMAFQMQLTCQMVSSTLVWSLGGESKLISLAQKQGFNEIFFFFLARVSTFDISGLGGAVGSQMLVLLKVKAKHTRLCLTMSNFSILVASLPRRRPRCTRDYVHP